MKNNSVVAFVQPGTDAKLPLPPTPAHVTLRRSQGLMFFPDEMARDLSFRHSSPAAGYYQMRVMMLSWDQTPAGSLPNDINIIYRAVRLPYDPHSSRYFQRYRAAIMRGWYLCSDFRLYHPWLAERVGLCWTSGRRKGSAKGALPVAFGRVGDARPLGNSPGPPDNPPPKARGPQRN